MKSTFKQEYVIGFCTLTILPTILMIYLNMWVGLLFSITNIMFQFFNWFTDIIVKEN
jgi:hypothetical protein